MQYDLGTGVLTWDGFERRSDRYGSVYLIPEGHNSLTTGPSPSQVLPTVNELTGRVGHLVATVLEARKSTHIGDLFRDIFPSTPDVGAEMVLGHGRLYAKALRHVPGLYVGLQPLDGRSTDWLDPNQLYRVHEQTVRLEFHED